MLLSLFFSSYLITQCLYLFLGGPATEKGKQLGRLFVLHCIYYFWIIFCVESVHRRYHWQLQPSQTTGQKIKPIYGSVELINDVPEIYRLLFQSREGVSNDDRLELFESQSERARSNKIRQHSCKMNRASWKEKKSVSGVLFTEQSPYRVSSTDSKVRTKLQIVPCESSTEKLSVDGHSIGFRSQTWS